MINVRKKPVDRRPGGLCTSSSYNLNKMYGKKDTNDGEYPQETDLCMKIVCRKSTKDML